MDTNERQRRFRVTPLDKAETVEPLIHRITEHEIRETRLRELRGKYQLDALREQARKLPDHRWDETLGDDWGY